MARLESKWSTIVRASAVLLAGVLTACEPAPSLPNCIGYSLSLSTPDGHPLQSSDSGFLAAPGSTVLLALSDLPANAIVAVDPSSSSQGTVVPTATGATLTAPTANGVYSYVLTVTLRDDPAAPCTSMFTIVVGAPPCPPGITWTASGVGGDPVGIGAALRLSIDQDIHLAVTPAMSDGSIVYSWSTSAPFGTFTPDVGSTTHYTAPATPGTNTLRMEVRPMGSPVCSRETRVDVVDTPEPCGPYAPHIVAAGSDATFGAASLTATAGATLSLRPSTQTFIDTVFTVPGGASDGAIAPDGAYDTYVAPSMPGDHVLQATVRSTAGDVLCVVHQHVIVAASTTMDGGMTLDGAVDAGMDAGMDATVPTDGATMDADVATPADGGTMDADAGATEAATDSAAGDGASSCAPLASADAGLPTITQLAAGTGATCGLFSDGSVRCWGLAPGDASGAARHDPVLVALRSAATAVAVGASGGYLVACAILDDRTVWCWGDDTSCMLGDASGTSFSCVGSTSTTARQVPGVHADTIAIGGSQVCITGDGAATCWGDDDGSNHAVSHAHSSAYLAAPTAEPLPAGVVPIEIAAGVSLSCARTTVGDVYCWGADVPGGSDPLAATHITLPGGRTAVHVRAAGLVGAIVANDGTLWLWGSNVGLFRVPASASVLYAPLEMSVGMTNVVDVALGAGHACVLRGDGTVSCWASNFYGQLGRCSSEDPGAPAPVPGFGSVTQISAGDDHTCARTSDGAGWCWGDDAHGQTTQPTLTTSPRPVQITE